MNDWRKNLLFSALFFCFLLSENGLTNGFGSVSAYGQTASEMEEIIRKSEVVFTMEEVQEPEEVYINQAGEKYGLKDWYVEPVRIEARREHVEKKVVYEGVEDKNMIPETFTFQAVDSVTGQSMKTSHPVLDMKQEREWWSDEFSFPAVFQQYDSDYYRLGTEYVISDEDRPGLEDFETALLHEIGLEPENYQVREAKWSGEAYEDENGILCRDAAVSGLKKLTDYQVTYGGMVEYPEHLGYQCAAVYIPSRSMEEKMSPAIDKPVDSISSDMAFRQREPEYEILRQIMTITLSLLLVVAILLLIAWLLVKGLHKISNRKRRNEEE